MRKDIDAMIKDLGEALPFYWKIVSAFDLQRKLSGEDFELPVDKIADFNRLDMKGILGRLDKLGIIEVFLIKNPHHTGFPQNLPPSQIVSIQKDPSIAYKRKTHIHLAPEKWVYFYSKIRRKVNNKSKDMNRPKLKIKLRTGDFSFTEATGQIKSAPFNRGNLDYNLMMQFADHPGIPFQTVELIDCLKKSPRMGSDSPDEKRRVTYTIKAIRGKLGKDIIRTTPNGYVMDCEVVRS